MPTVTKQSHEEREQAVLADLQTHFPDFTGASRRWTAVPAGQDPPDFIGAGPAGTLGLELTEWLDGDQMAAAKARESQRDQVHRILATKWEEEHQPRNFRGAFLIMGNERIARGDEAPLRKQFFAHAAEIDGAWFNHPDRTRDVLYVAEFPGYPLIAKYFNVRYIGGEPHGLCWIHTSGDGGAYDPLAAVEVLTRAIDRKLIDYSSAPKQLHLKTHRLSELGLLVHCGFNAYAYNTPSGPLSLEEIAGRAAAYYAAHPQRQVFDRVWFFASLDSADGLNALFGFPPGEGRVRWLAQLWPEFRMY